MEKHRFTQAISKHLERALNRQAFDDLVIVAPQRSLGELRGLLSGTRSKREFGRNWQRT